MDLVPVVSQMFVERTVGGARRLLWSIFCEQDGDGVFSVGVL